MDLLVGIVNLVVLLFIIEAWVNGRIPAALAKAVDQRLNDPSNPVNTRLDRLERRTDEVGARLDGFDRRLDELGARLEGLDTRLDGLDGRLGELDTRVGQVDSRLDRVDAQVAVLNAQTSQQLSDLDRRVRERLRGLERRDSAPPAGSGDGDAAGTS